jgi:hypothetical protein
MRDPLKLLEAAGLLRDTMIACSAATVIVAVVAVIGIWLIVREQLLHLRDSRREMAQYHLRTTIRFHALTERLFEVCRQYHEHASSTVASRSDDIDRIVSDRVDNL